MSDILQTVADVETRVSTFSRRMDPDEAKSAIDAAESTMRTQFRSEVLGVAVDLTPDSVADKYRTAAAKQYDRTLAEEAKGLDADLRGMAEAMDVAMVAAGTLPHPHDAIGHDRLLSETAKSVEKLRATIEIDRFERVFSGKSVAAVLQAYERGERDATLCWFVETQYDNGWADVKLANGPDDAAALLKLRKVIAARRVARADAVAPDLAVARERLKKIRTATLDSQFRHLLNDRRGLAAV